MMLDFYGLELKDEETGKLHSLSLLSCFGGNFHFKCILSTVHELLEVKSIHIFCRRSGKV